MFQPPLEAQCGQTRLDKDNKGKHYQSLKKLKVQGVQRQLVNPGKMIEVQNRSCIYDIHHTVIR